jgi:hypothetical protein
MSTTPGFLTKKASSIYIVMEQVISTKNDMEHVISNIKHVEGK